MHHVKKVSGLSLAFILFSSAPLLKAQPTASQVQTQTLNLIQIQNQNQTQTLYRCSTRLQPGIDTSPASSLQEAIDLYAAFAGVPKSTVTCYPVSSY